MFLPVSVCLSVCLSVNPLNYLKGYEQIVVKFYEQIMVKFFVRWDVVGKTETKSSVRRGFFHCAFYYCSELKCEDACIVVGNCDLKNGSRCQFCRFKICLSIFPPREYMSRFKSGMILQLPWNAPLASIVIVKLVK